MDTRRKILEVADDLVRRRGYNAFSYKDISEKLAIRPAAVHYYFPAKEDLGEAILIREIGKFAESKEQWKEMSPASQLRGLIDVFRGCREKGQICLMGSFCPDKETLPAKMQEQLERLCGLILEWVGGILGEERAAVFMATLMASLILARVQGDAIFDTIITQLQKDLI